MSEVGFELTRSGETVPWTVRPSWHTQISSNSAGAFVIFVRENYKFKDLREEKCNQACLNQNRPRIKKQRMDYLSKFASKLMNQIEEESSSKL